MLDLLAGIAVRKYSMSTETTKTSSSLSSSKKHFSSTKIYPWIVIGLCASLLFYKYILSVSPSIMSHELMKQFQVNAASLGNLAATFFYTYTITQLFVGVLIDRFGVRFLTGSSILLGALGAYLFSQADTLLMATLTRGMMGVGISFATVAYFKMAAVWFKPQQLAFVGGLLATAVMLGAVFGQAPLAWMLDQTDWRFVLFFCSILGLIIAISFMVFVRDAPVSSIKSMPPHSQSNRFSFSLSEIIKTLKNKNNWLITLYSGLVFSPLSVLGGLWGNPFLQQAYQLSRTQSAALISLMFIGFGLGSPLFGLISDRLGKRLAPMKWGAFLSMIFISIVIYSPGLPLWLLGMVLFCFGCAAGAFMLGFTLGTEINSLTLAATVVALINTGDSVFESFTEPLLGKLLDLTWNGEIVDGVRYFTVQHYQCAFIPLPIYFALGLLLLFFIKEPERMSFSP
jgi:sugar phosphate permease